MQMSARARRVKALTMVSLEKNVEAQKGFDYGQTLPIKQDVIDKYKETTVKEASSNSRYLSSPAHVQDVVRLRTLS